MKHILSQWLLFMLVLGMTGCTEPPEDQVTNTSLKAFEPAIDSNDLRQITVYKSPTCGCCGRWESHLRQAGFSVTSKPMQRMAHIKRLYQVPIELQSCHTAVIDGYVIEGHVPASDIQLLLTQKQAVIGLTAPGMPKQSPGMQPEGEKPTNYDVLSFNRKGKTEIFTSY